MRIQDSTNLISREAEKDRHAAIRSCCKVFFVRVQPPSRPIKRAPTFCADSEWLLRQSGLQRGRKKEMSSLAEKGGRSQDHALQDMWTVCAMHAHVHGGPSRHAINNAMALSH